MGTDRMRKHAFGARQHTSMLVIVEFQVVLLFGLLVLLAVIPCPPPLTIFLAVLAFFIASALCFSAAASRPVQSLSISEHVHFESINKRHKMDPLSYCESDSQDRGCVLLQE